MLLTILFAAFLASVLTFFSGFGLGTLLTPVFLFFFPVETAVMLTAVVHFLNNSFKMAILGSKVRWSVVLRFGLPAIVAAYFGARALLMLDALPAVFRYGLMEAEFAVTPVKLAIALLMILFAVMELVPAFKNASLPEKYLPAGGFLSGFFGGLSGHQGALRSMFLLKCGFSKEAYIATGVVIACLVDLSRLAVYGADLRRTFRPEYFPPMAAAVSAAFFGAWLGSRLVKKMTMRSVQAVVTCLLLLIAVLLGAGII